MGVQPTSTSLPDGQLDGQTEFFSPEPSSAYPVPVADLIPKARALAGRLGEVPSRNRLMAEFRIGASKARRVLAGLAGEPLPDLPAEVEARLRAVPDLAEPAPEPGSADRAPGAGRVSPAPLDLGRVEESAQDITAVDPGPAPEPTPEKPQRAVASWPLMLLAVPAFVAVWSGWIGLGSLTGFGVVHPLPGIADTFKLDSRITLPVGVETYAAYALRVWLSARVPVRARAFAKWSAIGSLVLGALGQVAYHVMTAAHVASAPWEVTTAVACLPVAVLGMGAALAHLVHGEA